jgi:prepilin-type processing-associated H-X9-DG protein
LSRENNVKNVLRHNEPTKQTIWGSAYAAGFNMCFCDGSVYMMSYTINATVHSNLGSRSDGQVTPAAN